MTSPRNRGKEGRDDLMFGTEKAQATLKEAVADMHYLLSRGYAEKSALQLVGNRHRLNVRQQKAVQGMSASIAQISQRKQTELSVEDLKGQLIAIDGFNLLIILESALSGAYVFKGLDDCYRDLSSVHGTYKRVQQTEGALQLVGDTLKELQAGNILWYFDQPVSNSGRLKTLLGELAQEKNYDWTMELDYNPDKLLAETDRVVVSSDAWVLDRAARWSNLAGALIESRISTTQVVFGA
ncbi:MAG: DUF434 domain-containing protein [Flavobacteriaceae bacterium]|nr:DUF434 domain-containing protein [Flavobacteriaceae bacterium]